MQDLGLFAKFMTEFWVFIKEYWKPKDTDEYFARMYAAGNGLWFKYGKHQLIRDLVMVYMKSREEALHEVQK